MTVQRFDHGVLRNAQRTPQGGIRAPAALTRVGVFRYRDSEGKEWSEYRSPEEVFAEDSLATLRSAPVTDLHPEEPITAESWRKHAVGHVGEEIKQDGEFVAAAVFIQDAEICKRIESGERKEVSCGYSCDIDWTPGVTPDGERYDAVQKSIRYNHAAIGPQGWGRAGPRVSLRLDGAAIQVSAAPTPAAEEARMSIKIRVGGKEYRADDATELAAAQTAVDTQQSAYEQAIQEAGAVRQALTEALTKSVTLEATVAALKAEEDAEPNESAETQALDAKLAVREKLRADARKIVADADLDGKTTRQIHELVVKAKLPETRLDSISADTLAGMFDALVKTAPAKRNDALAETHAAISSRADGVESTDPEAAFQQLQRHATTLWRPALRAVK